jgi:hypothetical protein
MSGSSQYKFGVLAKIVKHLKTLHQDGADHALSLEDILDETNQLDVGIKISQVNMIKIWGLNFSNLFTLKCIVVEN